MVPLKSSPSVPNQVSLTCLLRVPARSGGLGCLGKWRICSCESARKRKMSTRFVCVSSGRREFPGCLSEGTTQDRKRRLTNEGRPLVLGHDRVCRWKAGDDIVPRVELAVLLRLLHLRLVCDGLAPSFCTWA